MTKKITPHSSDSKTNSDLRGKLLSHAHDNVDSNLRGKLLHNTAEKTATSTIQLRGKLLRSARILDTIHEPAYLHAPTWNLELGNHGTEFGDLVVDGFEARNSNHSANQDAFAVNLDARRFAVADGLGGGGSDTEATAFLAKFISDYSVTHGIDELFDEDLIQDIYQQAHEEFHQKEGRYMEPSALTGKLTTTAATTLTYVELISDTQARIVTVGDSPAYISDSAFNVKQQFGEDAQTGMQDMTMGFNFRMKADGSREEAPRKNTTARGVSIVDTIVDINKGDHIVIGSDYLSETISSYNEQLSQFIGRTGSDFNRITTSVGKKDDATFIAINPSKLK